MNHPWEIEELWPVDEMVARRYDFEQVYRWVCEFMEEVYPDIPVIAGRCVYWTHAGCYILRCCGYLAILQAGSMQWPIAPDHGNDNDTHFAYLWKGEREAFPGCLPEIHTWVGLPDDNIIVDFATGELKQNAVNAHGLKWELPDPPPYLWVAPSQLPNDVIYAPDMDAIAYLIRRLNGPCGPSTATRKNPCLRVTI